MSNGMRVGGIFHSVSVLEGFHFKKKGVLLEQAKNLEKAGAEQIELTADLFDAEHFPIDYLRRQIDDLVFLKKGGMLFSLHAHCIAGIATGSSHESVRRASVETILNGWALFEVLEPITVTIHPNTLAEIDRDLKPPGRIAKKYLIGLAKDYEKQSLDELSRVIPPEKICLENYHDGDLLDFRDLIENGGHFVCFDFGHNYVRNPGLAACHRFFEEWKNRIRHIHLHNITAQSLNYGLVKLTDHQPLTDPNGLVQAEIACRMFNYFGYQGAIIVEEYHNKKIADSVMMVKKVLEKIRNER